MEFKITITFDPDTKDCRVEGPLKNEDLCNLGFELAREVMQRNRRRIIVGAPATVRLPHLRDLRGGN